MGNLLDSLPPFSPRLFALLALLLLIRATSGAPLDPRPCHSTTPSSTLLPSWLTDLATPSTLNTLLRRSSSDTKKTAIIAAVCSVVGVLLLVLAFFYLRRHIRESQERRMAKRDADARRIREQMKRRKSRVSEASEGTVGTERGEVVVV